jgi:hypothetical protein
MPELMLQNIRAFVPGGTFFFKVTLLERFGKLMILKAGCAPLSRLQPDLPHKLPEGKAGKGERVTYGSPGSQGLFLTPDP